MRVDVHQKLDLKVAMTQQLRKAIELLQMSSEELEAFLVEQHHSNPLIELKDTAYTRKRFQETNPMMMRSIENNANAPLSNVDQLLNEIRLNYQSEEDSKLLQQVVLNLDESGYFPHAEQLLTASQYNRALHLLENLDYVGVGAMNIKHCLLLQIEAYYPDETIVKALIEQHLEKVANHKWNELKKCLNVHDDELKNCISIIKSLNPKPFTPEYSSSNETIQPDIIIETKDCMINYSLSSWFTPAIRMTQIGTDLLSKDEKKQILQWENDYRWLSRSLKQRRETIIAIMDYLVSEQLEALVNGLHLLKPMNLKDVSEAIGRHESTISRATMNKYIQAPWGTFLMKDLFTSKVVTPSGEEISKVKIKTQLLEIVKNENKKKPLSDNLIMERIYKQEGVKVSRRTITKYREELSIPPSSKRKEL